MPGSQLSPEATGEGAHAVNGERNIGKAKSNYGFLIAIIVVALALTVFGILSCAIWRRRVRVYARREEQRNRVIDGGSLEKLVPVETFSKRESVASVDCCICIDKIQNGDSVRTLECGHTYHACCITPWLTEHRATCPLCKQLVELVSEDEKCSELLHENQIDAEGDRPERHRHLSNCSGCLVNHAKLSSSLLSIHTVESGASCSSGASSTSSAGAVRVTSDEASDHIFLPKRAMPSKPWRRRRH